MKIRYIKLGDRGKWEYDCIMQSNTLRLGYESPHHQESLDGDWDTVRDYWLDFRRGNQGTASRDISQIRDFYELSETDIWITFYKRKMYWCHAHKEVIELQDRSRIRHVIGEWSCVDKRGNPLFIENIDGRVSKVQGFRGTICKIQRPDYLLRKINGETQPEIKAANDALVELKENIEDLIRGLWWNDFELLVDLIFSQAGWQRLSVLGKTEKDVDIDIVSPVTQKRAFVQVKSATTASQFESYLEKFDGYTQYDEFYFVFHSFSGDLEQIRASTMNVNVWDCSRVAELVINAGLIEWLIEKRS